MQVIVVKNPEQGIERAKEEVEKLVDNKTVLFLSGGNTPKPLYEALAKDGIIRPAAVAMVDERFGEKMHETSNERMIAETGFLKYLTALSIPFFPILQDGLSREETAEKYDEKARDLFFHFPKSVGIMGIGADGHTAGIPPSSVILASETRPGSDSGQARMTKKDSKFSSHEFVTSYNAPETYFKERITLTFAGLSLLDHFVVLVFGKDKAHALQQVFTQGPLEEVPARFYLSDTNAKKTLFITDQKI